MTEFVMGKPCKHGHDGKRYKSGNCVECSVARDAERDTKPGRAEQKAAAQRQPHRKKYMAEYERRPEVKVRRRENNRLRNFGITGTEFNFTFAGQNFCCGKCGVDQPGGKYDWNADHCHETGRFRGVLCHTCNQGLGKLGDNVEGLLEAIEYIVGESLPTNLTKQILQMAGPSKRSPHTEPNESKHTNWSAGLL